MRKNLLGLFFLSFLYSTLLAKEKVIAKIPEASGICYSKSSNSLFVVNDEGSIYELSTNGKILREKKIGNYDLEAIEIDEKNNLLLLADEETDSILFLEKKDFNLIKTVKIGRKYKNKTILEKGGNGIEGLALYKNKLYASNQSNKKYPKKDSSVIVVLDYNLKDSKFPIKDVIDHGYKDISGLTFYEDILYMVSDKKSKLIGYNVENGKTIKKDKLPKKYAQEGIAFDNKNNLYIADDNGQILKIKNYKK